MIEPAETQERYVKVQYFWRSDYEELTFETVEEGIEEIKSENDRPPHSMKLLLDDDVVYFSERNGEIEQWEKEWKRQKRKMALSENTHDCPHDVSQCFENDLCIECKMDKAKNRAVNE